MPYSKKEKTDQENQIQKQATNCLAKTTIHAREIRLTYRYIDKTHNQQLPRSTKTR